MDPADAVAIALIRAVVSHGTEIPFPFPATAGTAITPLTTIVARTAMPDSVLVSHGSP